MFDTSNVNGLVRDRRYCLVPTKKVEEDCLDYCSCVGRIGWGISLFSCCEKVQSERYLEELKLDILKDWE